jgi:glutathione synthase
MYPMDTSPDGLEGRKLATDPESAKRFVLKPQREAGGNNIYRGAIPGHLRLVPESQWPGYVLMEMIEPPSQRNMILRDGEVQAYDVVCELGVFGTVLWRNRAGQGLEILKNDEAGYLLRTKSDQSEEGGVAAGFGSVDSVCLVDV